MTSFRIKKLLMMMLWMFEKVREIIDDVLVCSVDRNFIAPGLQKV